MLWPTFPREGDERMRPNVESEPRMTRTRETKDEGAQGSTDHGGWKMDGGDPGVGGKSCFAREGERSTTSYYEEHEGLIADVCDWASRWRYKRQW